MACSCCHDDAECGTGCGAACGAGGRTEAGSRARLEARLLAVRFVLSALLFTAALILPFAESRFAGSVSPRAAVLFLSRALFVLSWLVSGYRVVFSALRNILRGRVFDENFLMTVATAGAFAIGQWSEGAAVMLFYNLGELVQESAVNRSRRSITELMDVRPEAARLAGGDDRVVHASEVAEGSLIRVLPGEKVPLDGIVVEGASSFDTSRLTGESVPRDAVPGSEALAAFVNGSGVLVIRTTAVYAETAASKMLELIEGAQNRKAKAERLITSFARVYTPIVTMGAVALALLPPLALAALGQAPLAGWESFRPWAYRALVFLVISCPCAFVISVPLGFFGGIGGAAKRGILVKGADFIDVLAKAKAVVFDKTGTLTKGSFTVRSVEPSDRYAWRSLYALALAAEHHSRHPVAMAIRAGAPAGLSVDASLISGYAELPGRGISLLYDGKRVLAGSRLLLEENGVSPLPGRSSVGGTVVEIACEGEYAGRITLGDELKDETAGAIVRLRKLGVGDIVMLSGDTEAAAREMAALAGIGEVRAGVLPHQKVELFEEVSVRVKAGHAGASVLYVGDGMNDAPVLARADAGIAMGAIGSDAAIEAADVVLMNDNPMLVPEAIECARWTRHIVFENIALSFVIKIGFLALGAAGLATLWEAVFADVGVALLATVNSLRARRLPKSRS